MALVGRPALAERTGSAERSMAVADRMELAVVASAVRRPVERSLGGSFVVEAVREVLAELAAGATVVVVRNRWPVAAAVRCMARPAEGNRLVVRCSPGEVVVDLGNHLFVADHKE